MGQSSHTPRDPVTRAYQLNKRRINRAITGVLADLKFDLVDIANTDMSDEFQAALGDPTNSAILQQGLAESEAVRLILGAAEKLAAERGIRNIIPATVANGS